MTVTHLLRTWTRSTATTAASVVRHPIGSAAMAAGLVKGTAEAGAGLVRDLVRGTTRDDLPAQRGETSAPPAQRPAGTEAEPTTSTTDSGPREPQVVPKPVLGIDERPEPVVIEADDAAVGEAFHHEPKVASRDAEHGDGPADREELEADLDDLTFEAEEPTPVWTSETPAGGPGAEEPLFDEGSVSAVRSESEMLRKAADQQSE